jgi:hypothetical protein
MPQDKGDALGLAEVGDPIPGKEALDADGDVGPEGDQHLEEELLVIRDLLAHDDVAGLVDDTNRQQSGVQVDAAVESMLLGVETHRHGLRGVGGPEPASWLEGASFLKIPRWDKAPP